MKETIFKHALINAYLHNGKADVNAIIKKVIAENPSLRKRIKEVIDLTKKIVKEVNKLSLEEQKMKIEELGIKIEKKVEERKLPELPNAIKGKVVTAFPPEPSKYPHLGHAKAALLNYEYAKMYNGKFILRFEDSNPKKVEKIYYKAFEDGLRWLGIKWYKKDYISDFLPEMYSAAEFLIKKGLAYVCLCKKKEIKELRALMKECKHRNQSVSENLLLWKKMFKEFKEGKANLRLKIDMKHKNALMRDPVIMRIVDEKHPRTGKKYRVWPTYDFGVSLMDAWEKITHRLRSKEFEIRKELHEYIQKIFGLKSPTIIEFGRLNLKGVPTSGRTIRKLIKEGKLKGWDDPRLTTLIALKKRGFVPQAIKEFILSTGISKADAILEWEKLEAINRKYLDPISNRYFAVLNPVKISIDGLSIKSITSKVHPEKRNKRRISVDLKNIYIEKEDYKKYKGRKVSLIDLCTVLLRKRAKFLTREIKYDLPKIQWVSKYVKGKIIMSDGKEKEILIEPSIKKEKEGNPIQLVRIGFCKVHKLKREIILYFTHK